MHTVGRRPQHPITYSASAALLTDGARFNDELQKLPTGVTTFIPKGVVRFRTHDEVNRHAERCMTEGMARAVLERA